MDKSVSDLLTLLGSDVDLSALTRALFAIRAPRKLVGIIPAMRQFRDWRLRYRLLAEAPEGIPDYGFSLQILDRIADLQTTDEVLSGRLIERYQNPWTPLRPHTGDSVIVELLLVRAAEGVDAGAFEEVSAWLLRIGQRFHARSVTIEDYAAYLEGDIPSLEQHRRGTRLYGAYLALRRLADGSDAANAMLRALRVCFHDHSPSEGLTLAVLAYLPRWKLRSREHTRLRQEALRVLDMDAAQLTNEIKRVGSCLPAEFALLLRSIFERELKQAIGTRRSGGVAGRESLRPRITHGARLTEVLQTANEGDIHAGTVIEFFPGRKVREVPDDGAASEDDEPEDDDSEEPPTHPGFTIVLAQSEDLVRGYYAAKGIQSAIEYDNARLPWSKWALSTEAVNAILGLVAGSGDETREPVLDREARLAIGLSLISGRDLDQVTGAVVSDGEVNIAASRGLVIQRTEHLLHVRPGGPNLRESERVSSPFCLPRAASLRLPLPEAWRSLVASIQTPRPRRSRVVAQARVLLSRLRPELAVSSKGLRSALLKALDEISRGDLGVIAVLTEGAEANARNIIHYASYEAARVESWWREAAESLVGSLERPVSPLPVPGWVGARDAFDPDALASYFAKIRERLRNAESAEDWPRTYNLLTLYLAYWLGLGLAQRRTRSPLPRLLLMQDWVWVGDKRRQDGSTDRLVPLTPALREQIDAYVALASQLAIWEPRLDPLVVTKHGTELRLQYLRSKPKGRGGYVEPYAPSIQEAHEQLIALPANWGRKVARSLSTALPGRLRDAELGHWVRGRHAWDATSTLNARGFRQAWLEMQQDLEKRLGFELVTVAGCSAHRRPTFLRSAPVLARALDVRKPTPDKPPSANDGKAFLAEADEALFEQLQSTEPPALPGRALELLRKMVSRHDSLPMGEQVQRAEAACAYLRKRFRVPVFAMRPRFVVAHQVVLDAAGLHNLAYLQQQVLPAFERELACLPARSEVGSPAVTRRRMHIELGRLVMIGIWRLGLASWALIDAWLKALAAETPILAQGDNRYMSFRVRASRKSITMRRTVLLDDFSVAYLSLERAYLREWLLPKLLAKSAAYQRANLVEAALNAHLRSLGVVGARVSLGTMMEAAAQQLMLDGTPMVAAYARGQLDTEDLGDGELRRLGGLVPQRPTVLEDEGLLATHADDLEDAEPPRDVIADSEVIRTLTSHRSAYLSELRKPIESMSPKSRVEALLRAFALWLIEEAAEPGKQRLGSRRKRHFVNRVRVIAYALLGHANPDQDWRVIDGDVLRRLQELTRDQFPDRLQHGAWFQLHRFLSTAGAQTDLGGLEIGDLGAPPERAVSAKILSRSEIEQLQSLVVSPRSGIGNAALRTSAQRHLVLMAGFGLRRAESAFLRAVDYQKTLCRVQAYGSHSLKTAAADRVLPVEFADPELAALMERVRAEGHDRIIDPEPRQSASPDNFYDALSRLIKKVTQDDSMGSHHLRHTLVSRTVLSLHWDSAAIGGLVDDLPWLAGFKVEPERLRALLGSEGDAGQGMRALSAMVGHAHPITTIRHYTHVLFIALRGVLNRRDQLDLRRSFEHRLGGRSTLKRWVQEIEARVGAKGDARLSQVNRLLRARIEQRTGLAGIHLDETRLPPPSVFADTEQRSDHDPRCLRFDRLEAADRSLRDRHALLPEKDIERFRRGLAMLHAVPSGKKGSTLPRHPLEDLGEGTWVPAALAAGQATAAASVLCEWLEALRCQKEEEFEWLLHKWIYASERDRGRMLLQDREEADRAEKLGDGVRVVVEVRSVAVGRRDKGPNTEEKQRMCICCLENAKKITRDGGAVRWVMSYVAAMHLASGQPSDE